jgi:hypothetical protein
MPTAKNPPRFVLSYARRDGDNYLDKFFTDLRKEIAIREGLNSDDSDVEAGFRDIAGIPGGVDWSNALAEALQDAWSCVSLYTPNYFRREACGKEVQIFLERAGVTYDATGAAVGSRGILPVLWVSKPDLDRHEMPPAVVSRINFRASKAQNQTRLESEGLRNILRRSTRGAYADILNDIVKDLLSGFGNRPNPLPKAAEFTAVKNAFGVPVPPAPAAVPTGGSPAPAVSPAPQAGAGPATMMLFLIALPESAGLFAAGAGDSWRDQLEDYDKHLSVKVSLVDGSSADASALVSQLETCSGRNASVAVVLDPLVADRHQDNTLALLRACLASEQWRGAIILPDAGASLAPSLAIPIANIDRLHLVTKATVATLASDVRSAWLEVAKGVVNEAAVKREPPGGGRSADRPRVQGPSEARP